jgi:hypothetical protein
MSHAGARPGAVVVRRAGALSLVASCAALAAFAGPGRAQVGPGARAALWPAFSSPVLDTALILTGTFGELRGNHFHAGLDLSTGRRVGRAVLAPEAVVVRRVRASGVGYGRSLYLETADGRLVVFAHLDAFAGPVAAHVAAAQDSSGQYEQDLWPERGRFRFAAGEVVAWSGQSGAGGPHLHVEVRRGDTALHPARAGIALAAGAAPRLDRLVLEPLDDTSRVDGSRAARGFALDRDTVRVRAWGRLRAYVAAHVPRAGGGSHLPWSVGIEDGGEVVECRFDSVSWATDMAQSDYVFDRSRRVPGRREAVRLWAPAGFRPVVLRASRPAEEEAGTIAIGPGSPARALRLWAADLGGGVTTRRVWIEPAPPAPGAAAPAVAVSDARSRVHARIARTAEPVTLGLPGCRVDLPSGALFEPDTLALEEAKPGAATAELEPAGGVFRIEPRLLPLRQPVDVTLRLAPRVPAAGVGLYRDDGGGWEFVAAGVDSSTRSVRGATRRLGRFALFRDVRAPRVAAPAVTGPAQRRPYSTWALEAHVSETGSGVNARDSYLAVDGRRVPTEWDPEAGVLRWRPVAPPARGSHRVLVVATDRAGLVARTRGGFVVD